MAAESRVGAILLQIGNQKAVMAHNECIKALGKAIRDVVVETHPREVANEGIAHLVGNHWILTRRNFPNQYSIVLVFFSLYADSPKSTDNLSEWLRLNNLKMSNPSMIVKRLTEKDALAVIRGEDGVLRFFMTPKGEELLDRHLKEESD